MSLASSGPSTKGWDVSWGSAFGTPWQKVLEGIGGGIPSTSTWSSLGYLGLNANPMDEYNTSWPYRNLLFQARAFCPITDGSGYGYTNIQRKSDGYPVAGSSSVIIFASESLPANAGTYTVSVSGNNVPVNAGDGTLSGFTYNAGTNKTTGLYIMPSMSGGLLALRFNTVTSDFGNLEFMQPGYSPGDTTLLTAAAIAHYNRASFIRGMDRLRINGVEPHDDPVYLYLLYADRSYIHPNLNYTRSGAVATVQQNGSIQSFAANVLPRAWESQLGWYYRFDPAFNQIALNTHNFSSTSAWNKFNVLTITTQTGTGPNGAVDAWPLTEDTTTSSGHYLTQNMTFTAGNFYTFSVIASPKAPNDRWLTLALGATAFGSTAVATFSLVDGSTTKNGTVRSASAVQLANGNWLCSMSATCTTTAADIARIRLNTSLTSTQTQYDGNGTSGIYLWAANITDTDYRVPIVTATTAAVAIGAPSLTMPSLHTGYTIAAGGSLGFKGRAFWQAAGKAPAYIAFRSSSQDSNTHTIEYASAETFSPVASVKVTNTTSYSSSATTSGNYKYAMRYQANNFQEARNGVTLTADTSGALPSGIDTIKIGHSSPTEVLAGGIANMWVCPYTVVDGSDRYMNDVELGYMSSTTGGGGWSLNIYQGSKIADSGTTGYKNSLKGFMEFTTALGKAPWMNIPDLASDQYMEDYITEMLSLLPINTIATIEDGNELWNYGFQAWYNRRNQVFFLGNVCTGVTASSQQLITPRIISAVRTSNTVTVTLSKAPSVALTAGSVIYQKVESDTNAGGAIPAGTVTCIAGTSGSVIMWTSTGSNRTADIDPYWYNSYIYGNPTHEYFTALTSYGAVSEVPMPIVSMYRHNMTRLKKIYDIVSAAGATSKVRIVQGAQLSARELHMYALAWATEKYGNLNWLTNNDGGLCPAYYAQPSTALEDTQTDVSAVFTVLEDARTTSAGWLTKTKNAWKMFGLEAMRAYEGGPHNDQKHTTQIANAIKAAHNSDSRMETLLVNMYQDWINRGGGPLCYFHGGWTATYGGISYGGTNNNTWALREGTPFGTQDYQPKDAFFGKQGTVAISPSSVEGETWGTIKLSDVIEVHSGQQLFQQGIMYQATAKARDLYVLLCCPATGSYNIAIDAGSNISNETLVVSLDETQISSVTLPVISVFSTPAGEALSVERTITKGHHWLKFHIGAAPRQDWVTLRRIRITSNVSAPVERLVVTGDQLVSNKTGQPVFLRGVNQATWNENYPGDAADIVALGANCIRHVFRWWGSYSDPGTDSRTTNAAEGYIAPANLAQFKQEIQWAIDQGMWVVLAFDSDCGQNGLQDVEYCDPNGDYLPLGHNFWTDLSQREFYKEAWKKLASEVQDMEKIAMFEILPEPLNDATAPQAADVRDFYRELIAAIRTVDSVTPFLVGPRGAYEILNTEEAYLSERTDVVYTGNLLDPKVRDMTDYASKLEAALAVRSTHNVPILIQQAGRRSASDTNEICMRHALSMLNATKTHYTWWQWHQNTAQSTEYALYYKDGLGGWIPKQAELDTIEYFWNETFAQVESAAIAAATTAGGHLFYVKPDFSNVFQSTTTGTPCTALGQPVGRLNAVVGTNFFTQTTSGSRPSLVYGINGPVMDFDGTDDWMQLNETYFAYGDDVFVIMAGRTADDNVNRVLFHTGNSSSTVRYPYIAVNATDVVTSNWRGDDNTLVSCDSTTNCSDRALVVSGTKASSNKKIFVNGLQEGTTVSTTTGTIASITRTRIGASTAGSNPWNGPIAMIYIGKALTTAQQIAIERLGAYLAQAPYKGAIP